MSRPLLAAISIALAAIVLTGCAARGGMPFPDEAEAWVHDPDPLTR